MLYKQVLPDKSFKLLESIQSNPAFNNLYLAGGTSLALQIGHRISIDLDFFTDKEFETSIMSEFPEKYEVNLLNKNSIEIFSQNTKVFFFYFAFPLKYPVNKIENLRFANSIDVGLMKLLALQGRSTRKDIIDLYYIDKEVMHLEKLLDLFETHYPKESFNSYKSLKQIIDFSKLENEPNPRMFRDDFDWEECKDVVSKKVSEHIRKLLNP